MIIDCTHFFNENQMFLLRYKNLEPYVDKFIVVEALENHRRERFTYTEVDNTFPKYLDQFPEMVL